MGKLKGGLAAYMAKKNAGKKPLSKKAASAKKKAFFDSKKKS